MTRSTRTTPSALAAMTAALLTAAVAIAAGAAPAPAGAEVTRSTELVDTERVETPVATTSPITEVTESVVRVKVPLPASAGPRPEACDWLSYLRFRHEDGPAASARADRILVAQPGVLEGAGAFDGVARNTVAAAARSGRHIEFWALDRRSNCLEDNAGVLAGLAAGDTHLAVDYYYRRKEVDGRAFAGYQTNDQVKWLQNVGLAQTVRDQYDLMAAELPDQAARKSTMMCGGHSLGGIITGFFAKWDFDGDRTTTADAGYNQCAGYFALDTRIQAGIPGLEGQVPTDLVPIIAFGADAVKAGLEYGVVPRTLSAPAVINTETMNLLAIAGLAARLDPGGRSDLSTYIPSGFNTDTTYRLLFSKDLATFAAGTPTVKDFGFTNAAALGGLMDDDSEPLAFMQASVGFFDGGRIVDKDFPVPNDLARAGMPFLRNLLGTEAKAIPDEPNGPLYSWRDYDDVAGLTYKSRDGALFTTPETEVTAIGQLARSLSEHPLDFTEDYFPTKLVTDIGLSASPGIADPAVHDGGIAANPTIDLQAGDGVGFTSPRPGDVVAPGYQHLDVLTAATRQNGGRSELISVSLARFATGAG
ncbi:hypothetical protein [Spirillospora sp. NPDC047279]|uniref:hypothetical protein n=1 Tax=Spirillospora sp. NPDC047279 TaxID=3155478 RepID=UPI0033BFE83C